MNMPLDGVRVHLSGAVPDEVPDTTRAGIHDFVLRFATLVFREGGTILHGSHPTLLAPLQRAAEAYLRSKGRKDASSWRGLAPLQSLRSNSPRSTRNAHMPQSSLSQTQSLRQVCLSACVNG
jgi:hypothetical protein